MTASLFQAAHAVIAGGVNSPVRSFQAVGGTPIFMQRGKGACMYDGSGKRYIDYVGSWGPLILGHAHPAVIGAVTDAVQNGLGFGTPTEIETRLAEKICTLMPSIEQLRMVSSGTEAAMSAIRLARGFTGRDLIIKFAGCYHGHSDSLLVKAGSGALSLGVPTSPGVPAPLTACTLVLDFNDTEMARQAFAEYGERIAAVIVEPVAGNMNCIPGSDGFLRCLREQCTACGSVLIFDEVMTGFRVALGGAQSVYGICPDLTVLGKIIGGGLPVGAFGGRADIMAQLAPQGPVYQAGTLSGNPLAMTTGLATLQQLEEPAFYPTLERVVEDFLSEVRATARAADIPLTTNQAGSMFGLFFSPPVDTICTYEQVMACDQEYFCRFFHRMTEQGVYFAPSPFEAGFVSSAHTAADFEQTISAMHTVFTSS